MIPSRSRLMKRVVEQAHHPTKTPKMHHAPQTIHGCADDLVAMEQAIFKILHTERYQYPIYSHHFGVELQDLWGEPLHYVCPMLEQRITEALIQDDRIVSVDGFSFDTTRRGTVSVSFSVSTLFGTLYTTKEVTI